MRAIGLAKNVWVLVVGVLVAVIIALAIAGAVFGVGSRENTCEQIDWQGRQCEALDRGRARETLRQGASEGLFR